MRSPPASPASSISDRARSNFRIPLLDSDRKIPFSKKSIRGRARSRPGRDLRAEPCAVMPADPPRTTPKPITYATRFERSPRFAASWLNSNIGNAAATATTAATATLSAFAAVQEHECRAGDPFPSGWPAIPVRFAARKWHQFADKDQVAMRRPRRFINPWRHWSRVSADVVEGALKARSNRNSSCRYASRIIVEECDINFITRACPKVTQRGINLMSRIAIWAM